MTKQEMIDQLKLLSALESMLVYKSSNGAVMPDYLFEQLSKCVEVLEREIVK